jgi:hypothetical protein
VHSTAPWLTLAPDEEEEEEEELGPSSSTRILKRGYRRRLTI